MSQDDENELLWPKLPDIGKICANGAQKLLGHRRRHTALPFSLKQAGMHVRSKSVSFVSAIEVKDILLEPIQEKPKRQPYGFARTLLKGVRLPLYSYDQMPLYLQDNEHIHTGYRTEYTYKQAFISVLTVHNETGNIWTHLLGLFLFLICSFCVPFILEIYNPLYSGWDIAMFQLFLLSACKCFAFSATFHTFFCKSRSAYTLFGCLDYAGISMLICGSSIIVTYYTFFCEDSWRRAYMGLLALFGGVGVVGPMFPVWATPRFRAGRTIIYITSGILSAIPIMHYLCFYDLPENIPFWAMKGFVLMGGIYIVGAMIYALKIPERWIPGKLDFCGHSHQIWHICVVMAAAAHFRSSLELMIVRKNFVCKY